MGKMTRRESREQAVRFLYEYDLQKGTDASEIMTNALEQRSDEPSVYGKQLFLSAVEHLGEIDEKIASAAENWKMERISKVTLAVLRCAVAELRYGDAPREPVINEFLEIARLYDAEKAVPFINGILGKV